MNRFGGEFGNSRPQYPDLETKLKKASDLTQDVLSSAKEWQKYHSDPGAFIVAGSLRDKAAELARIGASTVPLEKPRRTRDPKAGFYTIAQYLAIPPYR